MERIGILGYVSGPARWPEVSTVIFPFTSHDGEVITVKVEGFLAWGNDRDYQTGIRLKLYGFMDRDNEVLQVREIAVNPPWFKSGSSPQTTTTTMDFGNRNAIRQPEVGD